MTYNYNDIDLSEYDELWNATEAAEGQGDYDEVPDGVYDASIHALAIVPSKKTGKPQVKWEFIIEAPSHVNSHVWKYSQIQSDKLKYLKKDLKTLGIKINKLSELKEKFESMLDLVVELRIKTSKFDDGTEFRGIYINKNLTKQKEDVFNNDNISAYDDDDMPF